MVEEILLERGIVVSYETIRRRALKFGADYARRLKRKAPGSGDIWHLDEVVVTINGDKRHLWRAVDQDGCVLDEIVQIRRNIEIAKRLLARRLNKQGGQSALSPTNLDPTWPPQSARSCPTSSTG